MPVKGGVRRKRTRAPTTSGSGDTSVVKYSTLGQTIGTAGSIGASAAFRMFIPGNSSELVNAAGPTIVSYYSTGRFLPGTKIRWEPNVSFTTTGRLFVGFTDNPEICATIKALYDTYVASPTAANYAAYANPVKSLGSVVSFPIWQETDIAFPTRIRRKRFDVNSTASLTDSNVLDRSMQTTMWVALEAGPTTNQFVGGFHYHDIVDVEGVTGVTS